MDKTLPRIAFWLVPGKDKRLKLQKLIKTLAERFAAVPFVPHVTIYSCHRSPDQRELSIMTRLARNSSVFKMKTDCLACEDSLTRALTIRLRSNASIKALHRTLHQQVPRPSMYELRPHLSLLYQHMTAQTRKKLVEEIHIEMTHVDFEELWAVAIPARIISMSDLINWQILLTCRLASRENVATIKMRCKTV